MKRLLLVFTFFLLCCGLQAQVPETGPPEEVNVYSYRMKGKVRLLFFWVGKDEVGGGTITVRRTPADSVASWREEIEVLFGSNPDRVPGGINRWGYGREESIWSAPPLQASPGELKSTVFEGFMKHSKEDSLKEVQKNNADQSEFLYDGIRSFASRSTAGAEIRTFATPTDFRYEDSDPVHCGYQERLKEGGPDRTRRLSPVPASLEHPFGFLTGVQSLIRHVVKASSSQDAWKKERPSLHYTYNGREYDLEVRGIDSLNEFDLPLADDDQKQGDKSVKFQNVAKTDFRLTNLEKNEKHDFSLWIPLQGKFKGVPIRIVDKPRWWLRVELNLEPEATALPPRASIECLQPASVATEGF